MKKILTIALISLIFTNCKPDIKNYVVDITTINVDTRVIKVSVKTNFPNGTNLLLTAGRIHFLKESDEEYFGGIYSEDLSVNNGKIEATVYIDDSKWYNEHLRLEKTLPDDIKPIAKIIDNITISVLFSPKREQSDNILKITGINGEYISGDGTESNYNFTTLQVSKEIKIPFQK